MEVDGRIKLVLECYLTAAACEAAARGSADPRGWQAIAGRERSQASDLLREYCAALDPDTVEAVARGDR